ncbi:MAG TPA: prepilin-type N-terminal cleavage/methylation domain-containing protein [Myxococcales bacterium]|nr:prepilin-type N-terminal cleavage/methylation domain-containing protein [Myxococcales bacterium]
MNRGFTLLEVMISLAILAIALVALSGLNGGAVAMHAYGRRATEATLLLRGKMLDVEDDLQKNGFSDFDDEKHGDFAAEGSPGYAWSAEILKPDVQLDPAQLMNLVGAGSGPGQSGQAKAGGIGGAATALAGSLLGGSGAPQPTTQSGPVAAMLAGPLGGVLQTQAKTFIETLKKSLREIRLTVSWPEGKESRTVSASQIVVILPESVGQTPATTQQPQIPPAGLQPGVLPGTPPRPGTQP